MNKWLYIPVNKWMVGAVVYHNEVLAIAAARKFNEPIVQLYRQLLNPEWKAE